MRRRGSDTKYVAAVLAVGTECDIGALPPVPPLQGPHGWSDHDLMGCMRLPLRYLRPARQPAACLSVQHLCPTLRRGASSAMRSTPLSCWHAGAVRVALVPRSLMLVASGKAWCEPAPGQHTTVTVPVCAAAGARSHADCRGRGLLEGSDAGGLWGAAAPAGPGHRHWVRMQ